MGRFGFVGKRELWMRRIQRFARCRLTVAAFCDQEQISIAAFYRWGKKLLTKNASEPGMSAMPDSPMTRSTLIGKQ